MAITKTGGGGDKVKGRFRCTGSTGSDADGRRGKREPDNSEGYHNIRVRRVTPESENEPVGKAAGNKKSRVEGGWANSRQAKGKGEAYQ